MLSADNKKTIANNNYTLAFNHWYMQLETTCHIFTIGKLGQ